MSQTPRPPKQTPRPPKEGRGQAPALPAGAGPSKTQRPAPTDPEVARARQRLLAARASFEGDLDSLSEATRSALDVPAKVRRNPVKTAALAGGAGFLLLGGPRRVVRAATGRLFPKRRDPYDGLLPDEVERVLRRSAVADLPEVREALERDFAEYLRRKGRPVEPMPSASTSLWRTYDALVGPLGTVAARMLVERLFAADPTRNQTAGATRGRAGDPPRPADAARGGATLPTPTGWKVRLRR
ncbi:MAG: hypothetical protein KF809_04540 [Chloroflexi bacterium]|nr:hypothetical protein [Chloroflexota bacterium]